MTLLLVLMLSGMQAQVPADTIAADTIAADSAAPVLADAAPSRLQFAALPDSVLTLAPAAPQLVASATPADTGERRRAVEHGDFFYTRAAIHRYASYAIVPLFVTEFLLGQKLYNHPGEDLGGTRSAHGAVAAGVGALFAVNTVTGVWNLWESRHEPDGRTRRMIHGGLMLLADAGFAWTATLAPEDEGGGPSWEHQRSKHRTVALTSMGVSLASYVMMLVWKN